MKCHIEITPGASFQGTINVIVETPNDKFSVRGAGPFVDPRVHSAAYGFLTEHGTEYGIEWFEDPGPIRYRMVKHPMGDTYSCVAVVPFMAKVVAS